MGNIYSALRELQALKAGTSNVTGVYVGTNLIWPLITPTPTITPTSTFTPTPTNTPTVTPTNTQTPTVTPTLTVTPTVNAVCPQSFDITSNTEPSGIPQLGTYTRATIASGITFDYGFFDQFDFRLGTAPDGNNYPIFQYYNSSTGQYNTYYRGFLTGGSDRGWYGRTDTVNPLNQLWNGAQRAFGDLYTEISSIRFPKAGSNTGGNPPQTNYIVYPIICPTPTQTPTNTITPTVTTTQTPTVTPTVTPTNTITPTVTSTLTPTVTPTNTNTPTVTSTQTPTLTPTNTPTNTATVTPTVTPTNTITPTPSGVVPTLTYITNLTSTANNQVYTYSSVNWGASGFIVVAVAARTSSSNSSIINSVTIGGITATLLQKIEVGATSGYSVGLYGATLASTSGNIVVTYNIFQLTQGIGVWRVNNLQSTTPISTNTDTSPVSFNLTANTGSNVVICAVTTNSGSNVVISSSTTPRDYSTTVELSFAQAGFSEIITTPGNYTFTASATGGSPIGVGIILQ